MTTWVFDWLATYFVHSSALLLLALAADRWLRKRPELASAVWKTALVAGVVTASLQTGGVIEPLGGRFYIDVDADETVSAPTLAEAVVAPSEEPVASPLAEAELETEAAAVATVTVADADSTKALSVVAVAAPGEATFEKTVEKVELRASEGVDSAAPSIVDVVQERADAASATVSVAAAPVQTNSQSAFSALDWRALVIGAWLLGCLFGLVRVAGAWIRLTRQLRGRRLIRGGSIRAIFERLCRAARVPAVRLSCTHRIHVPLAAGLVRPEICVPRRVLRSLSPASQESLLAHELAHVIRRDPMWQLLGALLERALFFQPLNRIATRKISSYAEYLCDAWAAKHTREPLALARCLTEVAAWAAHQRGRLPVPAMAGRPSSLLGARVQRLLDMSQQRDDLLKANGRPWASAIVSVGMFGAVALVAPGALGSAGDGYEIGSDCGGGEYVARAPVGPEAIGHGTRLAARVGGYDSGHDSGHDSGATLAHSTVLVADNTLAGAVAAVEKSVEAVSAVAVSEASAADSPRGVERKRRQLERKLDRAARRARKSAERSAARQHKHERELEAVARSLEAISDHEHDERGEHHVVLDLRGVELDEVERLAARAAVVGLEELEIDNLDLEVKIDDCDSDRARRHRRRRHSRGDNSPLIYRYSRNGESVTIRVDPGGQVWLESPEGTKIELGDHWSVELEGAGVQGWTPEQREKIAQAERRMRALERRAAAQSYTIERHVPRELERELEREARRLEGEARSLERSLEARARSMERTAERLSRETNEQIRRELERDLRREHAELEREGEAARRRLTREAEQLRREAERAQREAMRRMTNESARAQREAEERAREGAERARREAERMQREAERAQREAERMQREAERMRREAERSKAKSKAKAKAKSKAKSKSKSKSKSKAKAKSKPKAGTFTAPPSAGPV